jgi:hypothetical protein
VPPKNRIWPAPDGVDPAETFPGDHIRTSLEKSLRASGLEPSTCHVDALIAALGIGADQIAEVALRYVLRTSTRPDGPARRRWGRRGSG